MASRTVSGTATILFRRNRLRKSFVVQNEDTAIDVFIKQERNETLTVSSTDHDHRLSPGASLSITDFSDGKEAVQDQWSIIAASGTPRVSLFETEDIIR